MPQTVFQRYTGNCHTTIAEIYILNITSQMSLCHLGNHFNHFISFIFIINKNHYNCFWSRQKTQSRKESTYPINLTVRINLQPCTELEGMLLNRKSDKENDKCLRISFIYTWFVKKKIACNYGNDQLKQILRSWSQT